jgi:hypothetical protein
MYGLLQSYLLGLLARPPALSLLLGALCTQLDVALRLLSLKCWYKYLEDLLELLLTSAGCKFILNGRLF